MHIDKIIKREVISLIVSLVLIVVIFAVASKSPFFSVSQSNDSVHHTGNLSYSLCNDLACEDNFGKVISMVTEEGSSYFKISSYKTHNEAFKEKPYILKIRNNGSSNQIINIYIKENKDITPIDPKYTSSLTKSNFDNIMLGISNCNNSINSSDVYIYNYSSHTSFDTVSLKDNYIPYISNYELNKNNEATFCIWVWLRSEAKETKNEYLIADIEVQTSGSNNESTSIRRKKINTYNYNLCGSSSLSECIKNNYTSDESIVHIDELTYRYSGKDVNNYVLFNDELWRIIGVFDNNLKLIKNNTISDTLYYDKTSKKRPLYIRYQMNEKECYKTIENCDLFKYLNDISSGKENYDKKILYNLDGNYSYYQGYYNFLKQKSKDMIASSIWKSGVVDIDYIDTLFNIHKSEEVILNVIKNENTEHIINKKVGLINISDYLYASDKYNELSSLKDISKEEYINSNWMYNGSAIWTLSKSPIGENIIVVNNDGALENKIVSSLLPIRPVIYLKENIKVIYGDGTISSPYVLGV